MKISKTQLTPAKCALDLGDGSERGLYVNQDYILRKLGRPHRGINIMYCYYPLIRSGRRESARHARIPIFLLHGIIRMMIISHTAAELTEIMTESRLHACVISENTDRKLSLHLHAIQTLRMSRLKPLPRTLFLTAA